MKIKNQFIPKPNFYPIPPRFVDDFGLLRLMFRDLPIKYIYCILIGIVLGLFLGTRFYWYFLLWGETGNFNWERHFASPFTNQVWWGILVPLVFYAYSKFDWKTQKMWVILASILIALFHEITSYFVWGVFADLFGMEPFDWTQMSKIFKSVPTGFISQWIQYWVIWGLFFGLDYSKKYRDKEVELARIENQLSNAQLEALRLQLQPHFLFNTLNTISSLMEFNIKDSQKIVSKLGNLLRTVLDEDRPSTIPFRDELDFIKNYLDIEQVRFSDRLKITYEIDEKTLEARMPSLILQPLVENAIKHGFAKSSNDGEIKIYSKALNNNNLEIIISDDGIGVEMINGTIPKMGIGLKNVRDRLDLIYKKNYSMKIESSVGNGFSVRILLPFNWFPEQE
ncbi:MAG: histidine kinase [Bacteroidetes bacterium]|nr:histidine kinase [Bacteroidota bacterium]